MAIAAFVFSAFALLIAAGSLYLSYRADKRHERSDARDERRLEREELEARERRRGRPLVKAGEIRGGPTADRVIHNFQVRNAGAATIDSLWLWIEDGEGQVVSTIAGGPVGLTSGAEPVWLAVEVPRPRPDRQVLKVRWTDQEGEHVEDAGHEPRLSA